MLKEAVGKACYGTSAGAQGKGRFYPKGQSVAATWKCHKMARYILLKKDHGADIRGCHYAIAINFLREEEKTGIPYKGVGWAREYIRDTKGVAVGKIVLTLLISGTLEGIRHIIRKERGALLAPEADRFVQEFVDSKRKLIERRMYAMYGHWINEDSTTSSNRLYKLCEAIETRIMMGTIRKNSRQKGRINYMDS